VPDLQARRRLRALLALTFACWLSFLSAAHAAPDAGSILLVSDDDVPAGIERSVKRRLGQVSELADPKRYTALANREGAAPSSDSALTKIAPRTGAALIVLLRVRDDELVVQLRAGASGAVLSSHTFAMQGTRLKQPSRALRELVTSARKTLSSAPAVSDDEPEPEPEPEPDLASEPTPQREERAEPAPQTPPPEEEIMEDPELSERLATSAAPRDDGPRQGLGLHASVGIGPGVHALRVPAPMLPSSYGEIDTGLAPALELSAAARLGIGQWVLRAEAQYRTFLGIEPAPLPSPPGQPGNTGTPPTAASPLTSHSFVIGASPGYRFGGRNSVELQLLLGWTFRSLQASVATLPSATLNGLLARPAVLIPFGDGVFCLRLAPELIVVRASETNAQGFMPTKSSGGVGFGAEVAVDVRLAKLLGAGLQFRRSRIAAQRSAGDPAIDEEWYVAVQAVLSL
jgi:hypothetical protein